MDFDTQMDEILVAVEKRGGFSLDTQDKLPISETMSPKEALAAIKQLIESKQPEKQTWHLALDQYAPERDSAESYNAAIDAWAKNLGVGDE